MVHHQNRSSHKALETFPMATTPAVHQVNLPLSYYHYRSKGTSLPHQLETRSHTTCERLIVHSQTGRRSTSCAFCFPHLLLPQPHIVKPEGTTLPSLQPILIDDNGTPATWTLVLFQQAIDRQDRILQTEGRFSLLELLEIQPYQRNTPTTGQGLIARRR